MIAERQPCFPNPCKHNGVCVITEEISYICNCDSTGYTGEDCNVLIIDAPDFSAIAVDSPTEFSVSAQPDRSFILEMMPDSRKHVEVIPPTVMFSSSVTNWNVSITAKKSGMYKLEYRISDDTLNYYPIPPATILVSDDRLNQSNYFNKHKVKSGLLQQGCCQTSEEDIKTLLKCPQTDNKLAFISTCGWTSRKVTFYSAGIIFSVYDGFSMPIAIAGANFKITRNFIGLRSLESKEFDCSECSNNTGNVFLSTEPCEIENITVTDVQHFLQYESLAYTYLHHAMSLIPGWLELTVLQSNRIHNINSYMTRVVYSDDLQAEGACNQLSALSDGIFSVLMYSGSLDIKLSTDVKQIQANIPICFATNLCKGTSSPFYITIPREIYPTVESFEFIRDLRNKGWILNISSVIMSNTPIKTMSDEVLQSQIWNGIRFTKPHQQATNLVVNVKFAKTFSTINNINCTFVFSGTTHWFNKKFNKVFLLL